MSAGSKQVRTTRDFLPARVIESLWIRQGDRVRAALRAGLASYWEDYVKKHVKLGAEAVYNH